MKPTTIRKEKRQERGLKRLQTALLHRSARETRLLVNQALGNDEAKAKAAMAKLNWHDSGADSPAPLRVISDENGKAVAFGRTDAGQAAYDVLCSSMTGAEAVRRHPELTRDFVLDMRRRYSKLRRSKTRTRRR